MSHKGQVKSIVWKFFNINVDNETKVTCKLCSKILSRGGKTEKTFTTTNMKKHLQTQHQDQLEEEERLIVEELAQESQKRSITCYFTSEKKTKVDCEASSADSSHSQRTMEETLELKKIWDINSTKAKEIHTAIGEMIAIDSQPFSIVEDVGFTRLMKLLKLNNQLPSRKYFSTVIIPEIHCKVLTIIEKRINEASNVSFPTDLWTNNANASFIR